MTYSPTYQKFPEGSANRDYALFEKFPDGSAVWRGCELGMENVELKLQELARGSNNKFFAINLWDGIRSLKSPAIQAKAFRRINERIRLLQRMA
jgi:hypothetical protein